MAINTLPKVGAFNAKKKRRKNTSLEQSRTIGPCLGSLLELIYFFPGFDPMGWFGANGVVSGIP